MDTTIANVLANEARRQEATARVARLEGEVGALAIQAQALSSANSDATRRLSAARIDLTALIAGSGPGLTDDFGERSTIDQLSRKERFAGKSACVEHVKANPGCTETDAISAWRVAGLAATGLQALIQDPATLGAIYRQQLAAARRIPEATWEAQRAWIVATPEAEVMGL